MTKKKASIILLITILSLGLFSVLYSQFSKDNSTTITTSNKSNLNKGNNSDKNNNDQSGSTNSNQDTSKDPVATTPPTNPTVPKGELKDGTYTESITYTVPRGGQEKITTTIKLSKGIIEEIKNDLVATSRDSREYQSGFESRIKSETLNKKIDDLDLSRVGGASLTTEAFNQVVNSMLNKARL